jgi:ankyrin repeat protein
MSLDTNELFRTLIFDRDIEEAKDFLGRMELTDDLDSRGYGPQHWAAYCDEGDILRLILDNYPSFHTIRSRDGNTILHVAAQNACLRAIDVIVSSFTRSSDSLITLQVYVELTNRWGETALHLAASSGSIASTMMLLKNGASKAARDQWNRTAHDIAKQCGHSSELLEILYDQESASVAVPEEQSVPIPTEASTAAQRAVSEEFMKRVAKQPTSTASIDEVQERHIFSNPQPPSVLPSSSNPTNSVKQRIAISKKIEYPGNLQELSSMLNQPDLYDPAGKDMYGLAAIHKLASWNQVDCLELLLPLLSSEEVNIVSKVNGYTALHYSIENHADRALKYLLADERIDRRIRDCQGRDPAELAIQLSSPRSIDLLSSASL